MTALAAAFSGRRILLTGHTGFKGSWLALWLAHLGARTWGYALDPPTNPSNFEASRVADVIEADTRGDVRDAGKMRSVLAACQPEFAFHLAAQPLVRASYRDPLETFSVNVMGTASLLEAIRLSGRPCVVVVVSSDKCYEPAAGAARAHAEEDRLGGHDPYSASKAGTEIVVESYRRSFFAPERLEQHGVRLASARAGNVIGGGDWSEDRIVPDAVRALTAGEAIRVRSPRSVRPWQHVLEPLCGYLTLAARMAVSNEPTLCGAWNFGPAEQEDRSVKDLVETLIGSWGSGSWADVSDQRQPHEAAALRLSIEKARALGWAPRWTFTKAVQETAAWYRRYYEPGRRVEVRDSCLEQIRGYESGSGGAA